jgi:hypothetical protein
MRLDEDTLAIGVGLGHIGIKSSDLTGGPHITWTFNAEEGVIFGGIKLSHGPRKPSTGLNPPRTDWLDDYAAWYWGNSFGAGLIRGAGYGVVGGTVVVAGTAAAATVVPAGIVTTGILVIGGVGAYFIFDDIKADPTPGNVGENVGALFGGALVGGIAARPFQKGLSPPGSAPPGFSFLHEIKSILWFREGPKWPQIKKVFNEGPTTGGAGGGVAVGGAGVGELLEYINEY